MSRGIMENCETDFRVECQKRDKQKKVESPKLVKSLNQEGKEN